MRNIYVWKAIGFLVTCTTLFVIDTYFILVGLVGLKTKQCLFSQSFGKLDEMLVCFIIDVADILIPRWFFWCCEYGLMDGMSIDGEWILHGMIYEKYRTLIIQSDKLKKFFMQPTE